MYYRKKQIIRLLLGRKRFIGRKHDTQIFYNQSSNKKALPSSVHSVGCAAKARGDQTLVPSKGVAFLVWGRKCTRGAPDRTSSHRKFSRTTGAISKTRVPAGRAPPPHTHTHLLKVTHQEPEGQ